MHFIVGHPRSGTHLLTDLLNAAGPKIAMHEAFVELSPDESFIALATDYYEGRIGPNAVKEALAGYRVPTAIRVDANWKNTWVLPVLLELYPEARVLHLMRDPRRNVIACHNMGYYGRMEPHPRFASLHRWLQAMPAVRRPDWNSLGMFGRNCAFWVESHRLILEWRPALADRYSAVRLEDMRDPAAAARIFDFLGLARPPETAILRVLAATSNPQQQVKDLAKTSQGDALLPDFEECSREIKEEFLRICAAMAETLGYRL
jgi:hypothetical protein